MFCIQNKYLYIVHGLDNNICCFIDIFEVWINVFVFQVIVHPSAREIVAVYTIEESSMELIIQLAPNHPLGLVKVDSGKCMVSTSQTRQWLLVLSIFLTHQVNILS